VSEPSNWPLSQSALRVSVVNHVLSELSRHALTRSCYTTAIGYYPKAKSHEMKRTEHDDYILIYCADGKGLLSIANEKKTVKAGELFIIPPNTIHAYQADDEQPWTVYWCHFQGEQAQDFFDYIYQHQSSEIIRNMTDIDFIQVFRDLIEAVRDRTQLSDFIHASNLFRHILTKIERKVKQKDKHESGLSIHKVQQFMRVNINKHVSLEELASISHCSKYHFARQYQLLTGTSPLKYFIKLKMEHACFLLEQTSLSMSEIASQLGYDDALYFSRVFRKNLGQAPSAYRKKLLYLAP
jgi:AraC-like DNA-binding protein/mannose-6-phosphate isomerase-like protein (cupin superfamily)